MATIENTIAVPRDDLDDLFDYDVNDVNDPFREIDTNLNAPIQEDPFRTSKITKKEVDLGIDTEIKVAKKRAPIPKLDEDRLLSPAGIPKLRRIAKDRFKFKGKGHEYSDVARLLNLYQLWLDDLYPRAKFADGLAMIEKLGHKKGLQTMRREWINEGKPRDKFDQDKPENMARLDELRLEAKPESSPKEAGKTTPELDNLLGLDVGNLYSATPKQPGKNDKRSDNSQIEKDTLFLSDDELDLQPQDDDMDDLDALLAEDDLRKSLNLEATMGQEQSIATKVVPKDDNFDDEMEAMAGMDDVW